MTSINQNSFLCIFDRHDGSTVTKNRMVDQTSSINDISGYQGWYIDLWNLENERVTQQAAVVAETVIFTSFAPSADPCVAGGRSYVYQMKYDDGGVPDVDYMEDEEDRSADLGDGIASYPVVDLSEGTVVVQASDASISVVPIAGIIQRLRVRSWQENYDHVEDVDADGVTQND
jgi:Tfp pilus tip-associated adhesin PilY1